MTRRKGRGSDKKRNLRSKRVREYTGGGFFPTKEECSDILISPKRERNRGKYSMCKWIVDRKGYNDHVKSVYGPAYHRFSWIKRKLSRQPNAEKIKRMASRVLKSKSAMKTVDPSGLRTKSTRNIRWADEIPSPTPGTLTGPAEDHISRSTTMLPPAVEEREVLSDMLDDPSSSVDKNAESSDVSLPKTVVGSGRRKSHEGRRRSRRSFTRRTKKQSMRRSRSTEQKMIKHLRIR